MNKFAHSYYNSQQQRVLKLDKNILDLSEARPSTFFNENIYSSRTLGVLQQYNNDNELINFININTIEYIILNDLEALPKCILVKKIGTTIRKTAVRNFLRKQNSIKYNVLKIKSNNC